MPEPDFDRLRDRLLNSGVAPRHVIRIVAELSDHFEDLESEAIQHGLSCDAAKIQAGNRIGALNTIAQQVLSRRELKRWPYRFPQLARVVMPLVYVMMLPAAPIYVGIARAPAIARWCTCLALSGVITAGMLLVLQIAIVP